MFLILDLLQTIPTWHLVGLFFAGMVAFIISTISGGGGAMLLILATSPMIGAVAAPPVINSATFISNVSRLYLFWHDIDWSLTKYYVPSATIGAWLAALIFSRLDADWIQLLVGVFLVSTIFQYKFGQVSKTFDMPKIGFVPLGFIIAFMSTLVGGLGPILNPFYMNAGLEKERLIATKTANSFFVGIIQIVSYAFFGILTAKIWIYGIVLGLGAVIGNVIGKRFLMGISIRQFRLMLLILMVISGLIMIIKNIDILL
ncbi:sulfite exporter TauE/SafE family protein [Psychrobacter proteolyticus]|uniref:sulfite exporter TauE/SafE family protein n=1 Tax=Psychrobacter proteolyticus TaxID=147825 RepID=UPI001D100486|nr:sulfite exporter TauE/SafE family protein [Psychrobacter proteolyticus]